MDWMQEHLGQLIDRAWHTVMYVGKRERHPSPLGWPLCRIVQQIGFQPLYPHYPGHAAGSIIRFSHADKKAPPGGGAGGRRGLRRPAEKPLLPSPDAGRGAGGPSLPRGAGASGQGGPAGAGTEMTKKPERTSRPPGFFMVLFIPASRTGPWALPHPPAARRRPPASGRRPPGSPPAPWTDCRSSRRRER